MGDESMSDTSQGEGWWLASDRKWYPPQSSPPPPAPLLSDSPVAPDWRPQQRSQAQAPQATPRPLSSDTQVAPDWWLASDGRWYPPTATTAAPQGGYRPGMLPPAASRRSVSSGLAGTLQGFFWAAGGLAVVTAILGFVGLDAYNTYWDAPFGSSAERLAAEDLESADGSINGILGLGGLVSLVVFILIIIWTNQAHNATQDLWTGQRKWSSGWTVGGWFIPVANAVIPKLVLNEIERIALAPPESQVDGSWTRRSTLASGWWWWLLFLSGTLVGGIGGVMFDDPGGSPDSWRQGYTMVGIGYALVAGSAVAGALYIRKVSQALRQTI